MVFQNNKQKRCHTRHLFLVHSQSVSRILYPRNRDVCHLSGFNVAIKFKQSTPRHRASSPTYAGVYDLATLKLYSFLYCYKNR